MEDDLPLFSDPGRPEIKVPDPVDAAYLAGLAETLRDLDSKAGRAASDASLDRL